MGSEDGDDSDEEIQLQKRLEVLRKKRQSAAADAATASGARDSCRAAGLSSPHAQLALSAAPGTPVSQLCVADDRLRASTMVGLGLVDEDGSEMLASPDTRQSRRASIMPY